LEVVPSLQCRNQTSIGKRKIIFINHLNLNAMSTLRNKVQLIGHVGNDPEIKTFDGGKKLAKLNVATNESYKNEKGEKVEETQWHSLIAWGKTADIIEKYVVKGKEIAIEGKLTHRSYEDKNGEKRYVTEVVIDELLMLGSK
jgi:single-strand DNA-binding protein